MEVKRDILWRVYLSFLGIVVLGLVILGKAIYIQRVEGNKWIAMAQKQQQRIIDIDADRGTIYSEDGSMLSTSIPFFDIYIDFAADGLQEKNGKRFRENIDSLSLGLSRLFKDLSTQEYKRKLQQGFRKKDRYYLLKRNISFQQFKELRNLPLVRQGKNRSGFIAEVRNKRLNPFGLLANRTIGLSREFIGTDGSTRNNNVGLEMTYDTVLKGQTGKRLVRFIAGGVYVPVEGAEVDPEHGKDVITTLDVNIQDIAENALLRMMQENECVHGTCIVMEVKTGKIKAIANLGRNKQGDYWEDLNYAIQRSEPGSTFKLATMLALLEDKKVTLNTQVNLEKGSWKFSNRTVYDSEQHGRELVTVKEAFEYSSNVAMAKLVTSHYGGNPLGFINHLNRLRFNVKSGISLVGESYPAVKTPKSKTWSKTSLPWMSFGYEVLVSPLQTLMLYNSVANGGKMMKPYLVNSILRSGLVVKQFEPEVLEESICSEATLKALRLSLEGVCAEEEGTGYKLFQSALYKVAGKTGTALVANGNRGYSDHIYQSSFAGYFPAGNPKYSCIVVIRNKPFAKKFYGAAVAGPVFKEVADKLYALDTKEQKQEDIKKIAPDSSGFYYAGNYQDMVQVMDVLKFKFLDSSKKSDYSKMYSVDYKPVMSEQPVVKSQMPDVRGMGLKDALFLLEDIGLNVQVKGRGKVSGQSLAPGLAINKKQEVLLELN